MAYLRAGKILRINLTDGNIRHEPIEPYITRFIGGKGVNLKLLFESVHKETKPFDPENLLLFGVGPLAGTSFPGSCRTDVTAKSPVTGALGNSGMGGYLGPELKYAGYDHLVIEGKAAKPVYISIRDEAVEIRDASDLWGLDTYETPFVIRKELRDMATKVVSIGPAGEKLVVYASINSGTGNVAARTGLGAVMGSKNLKAVAVRGTKGIEIAKPKEFLKGCGKLLDSIRQAKFYPDLHEYGLTRIHDREMRGLYDLLGNATEECKNICEADFLKKYLFNRVGCFACPVACFDSYDIPGAGAGTAKCSPYGDLSWDLRNPDLMIFWKSFVQCQRYGLDARSLSNAIAWLMELDEKGIITPEDTDGLKMEWGSPEVILSMAKKMSYREGIGDLLADGLPAAAEKIGRGAGEYLLISKGSPSDMHIVPLKTLMLGSAVSAIGEDAQVQPFIDGVTSRRFALIDDKTGFEEAITRYKDRAEKEVGIREAADPRATKGKAELVRQDEERADLADITGICTWMTSFVGLPVNADVLAEFMTWGLGTHVHTDMLISAGMRMHQLERAFNCNCGLTREDDRVSKAYYGRLKPGGQPMPEITATEFELEKMKDDYYELMGWNIKTGIPTRQTLESIDLKDIADKLRL